MPFPTFLGRVNKAVTNRVMIHVARRPPFAVIRHRGRTSGREYRIPLNVFPAGDDFVFALTYGPEADWVKNVLAAGQATLEYAGEDIRLVDPRLVGGDDARPYIPIPAKVFLKVLAVDRFLMMSRG